MGRLRAIGASLFNIFVVHSDGFRCTSRLALVGAAGFLLSLLNKFPALLDLLKPSA